MLSYFIEGRSVGIPTWSPKQVKKSGFKATLQLLAISSVRIIYDPF